MVETATPSSQGAWRYVRDRLKRQYRLQSIATALGHAVLTGSLAHLFNGSAGDLDHGRWQL